MLANPELRNKLHWEAHAQSIDSAWGPRSTSTLEELKEKLKEVSAYLATPGRLRPSHAEGKICDRLVELYDTEKILWRQRAPVEWLAHRDKNTYSLRLGV